MSLFPEELIQYTHSQAEKAAQDEEQLKAEAAAMSSVRQLLAEFYLYLNKGWPLHILDARDRQPDLIQHLEKSQNSILSIINKICDAASKESAKLEPFPIRFPQAISEACSKANLPLDNSSRHPDYTFDQRFIKLRIDDAKRIAIISNYEVKRKSSKFPADVEAIIENIQKERRRLFDRSFEGEVFIKQLRDSYKALVDQGNLRDGDSVPIRDVYNNLGNSKLKSDEFLVDLSRLMDQGPKSIDDRCLELQQTKDDKQGMLLLGKVDRGYTGFILFKKKIGNVE
jgi:hypothetical protein